MWLPLNGYKFKYCDHLFKCCMSNVWADYWYIIHEKEWWYHHSYPHLIPNPSAAGSTIISSTKCARFSTWEALSLCLMSFSNCISFVSSYFVRFYVVDWFWQSWYIRTWCSRNTGRFLRKCCKTDSCVISYHILNFNIELKVNVVLRVK